MKPLNSMPMGMPGEGPGLGPGPGPAVNDMPNVPRDLPQDLPQGVGPLPGAPMVPMGPNGGPQPFGGGMQQQQFGGQGGFSGGYDNDNWYESPSSGWNAGGGGETGWNNQGSSSKWWQSGVSQSNSLLQGNSRKTWSSQDPWNQRSSHIHLQSERPNAPMEASIDFLQGPGNVARQMKVYSMDGHARPVRANFANPSGGSRGYSNTIDVKNTGPMEFPLSAGVSQTPHSMGYGGQGLLNDPRMQQMQQSQMAPGGMSGPMRMGGNGNMMKQMKTIQGESLKTYSFDPYVNYVQVDIETDGMPCYATIEVSQGPGDARQTFEVYSDDGSPWQGIVETPGYGSTILVKNVGPMAYPIKCACEPIG